MDLSRFAFKREGRQDAVLDHVAKRPRLETVQVDAATKKEDGASGSGECEGRAERWLQELELIKCFRSGRSATVDEFHAFLLSLHGPQGRFWALVACLLSVQCRDVVALEAVKALMRKCPGGATEVRGLSIEELLETCGRCNYCQTKASNIKRTATAVAAGGVPSDYQGLTDLPGVGPKIAHLMVSVAFGEGDGDGSGIVVDTHVHRVARQLGWATGRSGPEATRVQLQAWVPRGSWANFTTAVVGFGQLTQRGSAWRDDFAACVQREYGAGSAEVQVAAAMAARLTPAGAAAVEGASSARSAAGVRTPA